MVGRVRKDYVFSRIWFSLRGSYFNLKRSFLSQSFLLFSVLASMMTVILFLAYINIENIENLQSISADRWHSLPVDNWIPKFFADAILRADIPSPHLEIGSQVTDPHYKQDSF